MRRSKETADMKQKEKRNEKGCTTGRDNRNSRNSRSKDILGYVLLGISVILLGKSLTLCFSNDIWYDELFTVGMIRHSYGELIDLTARDVHPPLYYMIVKFFVDLCKLIVPKVSAVAAAKLVSVLPYFVLLFYSVTFIRKRFSVFAGGLFLLCVIAMPQLSAYTVEMRMYSWALLFVTAAFLHGYGMVTARKCKLHGAAMAVYGLAAAYTQYFAAVAVAMVYLYVLFELLRRDRRRISEWLLWVAVSVAGYAAWLVVLYRQITAVSANYWILPLNWRSLGGCVKFLMKPAFTNEILNVVLAVVMTGIYAVVVLYSVVCVVKLYHNRRENGIVDSTEYSGENVINDGIEYGRENGIDSSIDNRTNDNRENSREKSINVSMDNSAEIGSASEQKDCLARDGMMARAVFLAGGVCVLAGLILFGFAASMALRPIFVYRYMIPALGCFWLSFAVGLDSLWGSRMCAGIAFGITLFIVTIGLRDYQAFMGEEEYKIRLMTETETALTSIAKEDIVLYNFDQVQAVTAYYLPAETESYLWCGTPETLIQEITRSFETIEETEVLKGWCEEGRTVWFLGSFNSRDAVVEEWKTDGLQVEETGSYLLERYWFNLYRISI